MNNSPTSSFDNGNPPAQSRKKWLIENVTSLALALLIVFMIRSSIVEAFKIPSGSMIPTLHIGDHIFVNKFAYGLKVPFSDLFTETPTYIVKRDGPKHGDIVVFKFPKDESIYYIKRIVGVPGDTVEIRNRVLYINNQAIPTEPITSRQAEEIIKDLDDPKYSPSELEVSVENLDGQKHWVMINRSNHFGENFPAIKVPPSSYFVMGDNRDYSNDSRYWGFVPAENIKGKAMIIWLSLWIDFRDSQYRFEPGRIGTILHREPKIEK